MTVVVAVQPCPNSELSGRGGMGVRGKGRIPQLFHMFSAEFPQGSVDFLSRVDFVNSSGRPITLEAKELVGKSGPPPSSPRSESIRGPGACIQGRSARVQGQGTEEILTKGGSQCSSS